jgi:hypothetical protein
VVRRSKYDKALLAPLVASSRSLAEVMRKLGLQPTGGNHRMIAARIRQADLDTTHFGSANTKLLAGISRQHLEEVVPRCTSVRQVLAALGLPTDGRPHYDLTRRLRS